MVLLDQRPVEQNRLAAFTSATRIYTLLTAIKGESIITFSELPESVRSPEFLSTLEESELFQKLDEQRLQISTAAKAQLAIRAIELGQSQRPVLSTLSWREFEEFIATIFSRHGFIVTHGFRFKAGRRYEIDVIAAHKPTIFCVDCKQYGVRTGKASPLRTAVEDQLQRVEALAANFAAQQAKLGCLGWQRVKFYPLLVTMLHEDLMWHNRIPLVPAAQLNRFMLSFSEYSDRLHCIEPTSARQQTL
ncbi:MAG: restriction endonuclease [Promethearchaeota archaeon]